MPPPAPVMAIDLPSRYLATGLRSEVDRTRRPGVRSDGVSGTIAAPRYGNERTAMANEDGESTVRLPPEAMTSWMLSRATPDERRVAKHTLVEQTRGLINAVTMLDVNPDSVDAATVMELAEETKSLAERVAALPRLPGGPADAGGDDARLLERSGI